MTHEQKNHRARVAFAMRQDGYQFWFIGQVLKCRTNTEVRSLVSRGQRLNGVEPRRRGGAEKKGIGPMGRMGRIGQKPGAEKGKA